MYDDDQLIMLSGIQHIAFCERQYALAYIEMQWSDNLLTTLGQQMHERVNNPTASEKRQNTISIRSFPLVSHQLGFSGRADVVEFISDTNGIPFKNYPGRWRIHPVEYKRGNKKPDDRDEVQLCAQAICLEEMFETQITVGSLYYGETRHRLLVPMLDELRKRVFTLAARMHDLFNNGSNPLPVFKPHCKSCSLIDICLPDKIDISRSIADYNQKLLLSF